MSCPIYDLMVSFIFNSSALCLSHMLLNLCSFDKDWKYFRSVNSNNQFTAMRINLLRNISVLSGILSACLIALLFIACQNYDISIPAVDFKVHFPVLMMCEIIYRYLLSRSSSVSSNKKLMEGVNCSTGMAYAFFYGYLDIILPNHGYQNSQSIRERIEDFILEEQLAEDSFPIKKMFVLVPTSAYVPGNLADLSEGKMEEVRRKLSPIRLNRAGSTQRIYENTVYRIAASKDSKFGGKHIYAAAEGPAILLTLFNMFKSDSMQPGFSSEERALLTFEFYKTLISIIHNDVRSRDMCHIIYYEDYCVGRPVNVADIIVREIEKLKFGLERSMIM